MKIQGEFAAINIAGIDGSSLVNSISLFFVIIKCSLYIPGWIKIFVLGFAASIAS